MGKPQVTSEIGPMPFLKCFWWSLGLFAESLHRIAQAEYPHTNTHEQKDRRFRDRLCRTISVVRSLHWRVHRSQFCTAGSPRKCIGGRRQREKHGEDQRRTVKQLIHFSPLAEMSISKPQINNLLILCRFNIHMTKG